MFPIDSAMMPTLPVVRQALVVLDLQNDFLSSDGALPVRQPSGFVQRILDLVHVFRESETGDVIWIRTEFNQHRPVSAAEIITDSSETSAKVKRGRRPAPDAADADAEAFLSVAPDTRTSDSPGDAAQPDGAGAEAPGAAPAKPECVRKGTRGAELAEAVAAAVDHSRDIVFTKATYSALDPSHPDAQKLVQLLRLRFVRELFVCGSLTNVSVFATAVGAGRFGFDTTVVSDCCGYRDVKRHHLALSRLEQLAGGEALTAAEVAATIEGRPLPSPPPLAAVAGTRDESRGKKRRGKGGAAVDEGGPGPLNTNTRMLDDRDEGAEPLAAAIQHSGLSPSMTAISLFGPISPESPPAHARRQAALRPDESYFPESTSQPSAAELLASVRSRRESHGTGGCVNEAGKPGPLVTEEASQNPQHEDDRAPTTSPRARRQPATLIADRVDRPGNMERESSNTLEPNPALEKTEAIGGPKPPSPPDDDSKQEEMPREQSDRPAEDATRQPPASDKASTTPAALRSGR